MDFRWQNVNFHFEVAFNGIGQGHLDAKFQSVTGLDVQFETETIKEGGENRFEHVIPTRRRYADLTLKRGILSPNDKSILVDWCKRAFEKGIVRPVNLDIILLGHNHKPIMKWMVSHAWPKSWKTGELNAEKGEILIETLELSYNYFLFAKP